MKLSIVATLLLGLASCMDTSEQPKPQQFPNAEYRGNVSSLYEIGASTSGSKAVDFKWRDSTGQIHSLSEYRGRPVLLNVWATNCAFCKNEMPMLNTLQKDKPSMAVIGLSIDNTSHSFQTVLDYATTNNIGYQLVVDSTSSLFLDYVALSGGSYVLPETFIIGTDGKIEALLQGEQTRNALDRWIP